VKGQYGEDRLSGGDPGGAVFRIGWVAVGMILMFTVFWARLFYLQIIEGEDLLDRSERNSVRHVELEAPRGDIVDREGRVLATTRPAYWAGVTPIELGDRALTFDVLSSLLRADASELDERVGRPSGPGRFRPFVLAADLAYDDMAAIESHRYALAGVATGIRPRRHYVEGERAAHLLGTIGEIQKHELESPAFAGYEAGQIVGHLGLERELEAHLRGEKGGRNLIVDVAGREIEELAEVEPIPGGRVVLALDLDLQRVAERAFESEDPEVADHMGALVALDPNNGDVLAFVAKPDYDPNAFAGGIDSKAWSALTQDEWKPLQNRAIAGQYSPGSTYKVFVAAAGLAEGIVDPEHTVFCPGHYRLGRRVYRCWKRGGHGEVNLAEALKHSCDVYFYELGIELGVDKLAEYAKGFGLGTATGLELPGERSGLIPTREWKERVKKEPWIKGETVSTSIGQGFNLVTPFQLAVAYAAIANGGTLYAPRLVQRLETWDGKVVEERTARELAKVPASPEHLQILREALTAVVEGERGTGARARVPGVQVAGKTGTTQVVSLSAIEGLEEDEIPVRYRDHALFAAFAPAEAPEIVVAVVIEHGGGGGSVAAPVAQKVLEAYFQKQRGELRPSEPRDERPEKLPAADGEEGPELEARSRRESEEVALAH